MCSCHKGQGFIDRLIDSKRFPEVHIPGYNFCGPGTNLKKRLNKDGTPRTSPINQLDNICYHHDLAYENHPKEVRRHADKVFLEDISNLLKDKRVSRREKFDAMLAYAAIGAKYKLGLGKKKRRPKRK